MKAVSETVGVRISVTSEKPSERLENDLRHRPLTEDGKASERLCKEIKERLAGTFKLLNQ